MTKEQTLYEKRQKEVFPEYILIKDIKQTLKEVMNEIKKEAGEKGIGSYMIIKIIKSKFGEEFLK